MARLLSRLLHISLGKGKDTVKVHEEIEHVECYIGIQKLHIVEYADSGEYHVIRPFRIVVVPKMIFSRSRKFSSSHGFAGKDKA